MWLLSAAVCSTVWQRTRPRDRSSRRKRIAHPAAFIGREVPRVQLLSSSVEGADAQSWIKVVVFHLARVFVHTVLQLLLMPCARPCLPSHVREGRLGAIAFDCAQILESRRQRITFRGPPPSYISALAVVRARPSCKNVHFILRLPLLLLMLLLLMPLHTVRARPNSVALSARWP